MNTKKSAIIIGAGPAGLTAAYELVTKTDIQPIILEKTNDIGGISKTVVHRGNRMDVGGHRFFSKSDAVMKWWQDILPIQGAASRDAILIKKHFGKINTSAHLAINGPDPEKEDGVMLVRNRVSRIFFLNKFFDYPVKINWQTLSKLGMVRTAKILWSYFRIRTFPVRNIRSLEDFFINRFGNELYEIFFKDYTEKVWGVPCREIAADWGAQRIKDLSVSRTLIHAIKTFLRKDRSIEQKETDTSLIERFLYPKYGPGQMWETVARIIEEKGGVIIKNAEVTKINLSRNHVEGLIYHDHRYAKAYAIKGDYFLSSMSVKDLISAMGETVPESVIKVSKGLRYRDSITVGLLLNQLKIKNETRIPTLRNLIPDNWIYIQDRNVRMSRIQIYNNWSPYLLNDFEKIWIGVEYCCNENDALWSMSDMDFIQYAIEELHKVSIIDKNDVLDSTVVRTPKTYPAYVGTYAQFDVIKTFTDSLENLFLIGRNGMHKYYNQDHAMLTAMTAVKNILSGKKSKENIWNINVSEEYFEMEND